MSATRARFAVRMRLYIDDVVAIGPGKVDLLEEIAETGSIAEAARHMGMSYKRAWTLVKTMNTAFAGPLVASETGGKGGGGAELTPLGQRILATYRQAEAAATKASAPHVRALKKALK
ncbi:MAG: molybdate transport system regulatory protein [Candidatus Sumerlaeota bacterium]|nr:molybdate transport system regulatory protein [Candidatus Sumerlaeota bacterium]